MRNQQVFVKFKSPCEFEEKAHSYFIEIDDETLQLPLSQTTCETDESGLVTGVTIPKWLADDRGLKSILESNETESSSMERDDWFLLGAMVAFLIRGDNINDAVWNACKTVNKLKTVYGEE